GYHRQIVDPDGRFQGIELHASRFGERDLSPSRMLLATAAMAVSNALEREGYLGPFGVDSYFYRPPAGGRVFHPLGEINVRMTFGLIARVLLERLSEPLGIAPDARVRLLFGARLPETEARVVPLLLPGARPGAKEGGAAWLEVLG
ncbi:MAG TPA: hypothetical protein VMM92_01890, partial [Thermoanaerobaculia bacterium]|nr:hypothetical protein [Thermoanaerobaculia bacterium]